MKKFLKITGISILVIAALFFGAAMVSVISDSLLSENEKAVNNTLKFLNTGDGYREFDFHYWGKMRDFQYYSMSKWKLFEVPNMLVDTVQIVLAAGETKNGLGITVPIEQYFYVYNGKIVDTKGVFNIKVEGEQTDGKKFDLLMEILDNVTIVSYSATRGDYGNYIKGEARVRNGASVPVENLILKITYFDGKNEVSQTDEVYISKPILPGQSKQVTWHTSPCSSCKNYKPTLDFSRIR